MKKESLTPAFLAGDEIAGGRLKARSPLQPMLQEFLTLNTKRNYVSRKGFCLRAGLVKVSCL